jgi:hypothetical protein
MHRIIEYSYGEKNASCSTPYVHYEIHPHSSPEPSFLQSQQSLIGIVSSNSDIKRVSAVGFTQLLLWGLCRYENTYFDYVKGTAVPLQAWSGPGGSRMLKFPDFMTTAQDGG